MRWYVVFVGCFVQAEDGIRDLVRSRGLVDVYKRQVPPIYRRITAGFFMFRIAAAILIATANTTWRTSTAITMEPDRTAKMSTRKKRFRPITTTKRAVTQVTDRLFYTTDASEQGPRVDLGGGRSL